MALTELQNCQRGILFLELILAITAGVFLTIKHIRKQIDYQLHDERKYAESPQIGAIAQMTIDHFAVDAIQSTVILEDDECATRAVKKFYEFLVNFKPILLTFPLNLISGTSFWFCMFVYVLAIFFALTINVYKIHRLCIDHIAFRFILEQMWIILAIILLINIWTTGPSLMPYTITQG